MTYQELKKAVRDEFMLRPVEDNKANKCASALIQFMRFYGRVDTDKAWDDLSADQFETKLAAFTEAQGTRITAGTLKSLKSHLRQVRKIYEGVHTVDEILNDTSNFAVILKRLILLRHRSVREFYVTKGFPEPTIRKYISGRSLPSTHERISELEKALDLKAGTLAKVLPVPRFERRYVKLGESEGTKHRALIQKQYRLKEWEYPQHLKDELEAHLYFKTADHLPDGMARSKDWRIRENIIKDRVPSHERFLESMNAYFGYLRLPISDDPLMSGQGLKTEELSLALYADPEKLRAYKAFHIARANVIREVQSRSSVSGSYTALLGDAACMTHPNTGFLTQRFDLFAKRIFKEAVTPEAWQNHCSDAWKKIYEDKRHLERSDKVLRQDKFKKIEPILNRPRPLDELHETMEAIKRDIALRQRHRTNGKARSRSSMHEDTAKMYLAFLAIASVFPFRIENFKSMELGKHLYKKEGDAGWTIRFGSQLMKNFRSSAVRGGVEVAIDPIDPKTGEKRLVNSKYVDDYIQNVRPRRMFYGQSELVFLPDPNGAHVAKMKLERFQEKGMKLDAFLLRMSKRYTPSGIAINSHSYRHIVATHYVKTGGSEGIRRAAMALFDTEFTVKTHYGRFTSEDKSLAINSLRFENEVDAKLQKKKAASQVAPIPVVDPVQNIFATFPMELLSKMDQQQLQALVLAHPKYVQDEFLRRVREKKRQG